MNKEEETKMYTKRFKLKKVQPKTEQEELTAIILNYAINKGFTCNNILKSADDAVKYMRDNAILETSALYPEERDTDEISKQEYPENDEEFTEQVIMPEKYNRKCPYLGCKNNGEKLDDVELAPGFVVRRFACSEHQGQMGKKSYAESKKIN